MEDEHKPKKEKKSKKKEKNKWALSLIIGVGVVVALIIIFAFPNNSIYVSNDGSSNTNQNQEAQKTCRDVQVPYDYEEVYWETVPYTDRECETKNLVYSATNNKWDYSTCNHETYVCYDKRWWGCANDTYFCDDISLSYSVDINNLDEEQGSWAVNIHFYSQGSLYKTIPITQFLYPKTTKTFTGTLKVTGDSPAGDANQKYSASYSIESIPTKQICRDVTKYQEIQKTRTITRYRTEQKCD